MIKKKKYKQTTITKLAQTIMINDPIFNLKKQTKIISFY